MFKKMRSFYLVAIMLMLAAVVNAQVTTASMSGKISSGAEPIIGATIMAVHESSGTRYGAITNIDGRYAIEGMRTGVYNVEVSYVGYTTIKFSGIILRLGDNYILNAEMKESTELLDEVIVVGNKTKFGGMKTGASTNISNEQLKILPSIDRSLSDFTRLSPYAGANNSLAGRDGRTNTFTIDGANLNNNFGLSNNLPGGGNPISLDAIEEVQVVIAPFDVRQTNFVGGGVNAITKSGTNTFRGSAYTYQRNQNFRGNKIEGERLGDREKESTSTYGFTLGGPIIKDKLFFFVNGEYENSPQPITKWKLSTDGKADADNMISRVTANDMKAFSDILQNTYGYNPGSYTDYDGGTKNYKALARIDWNINDSHKLSVRYNWTKNSQDMPTNGNSTVGDRSSNNRISKQGMAFLDNCYKMGNDVSSLTAELNSRFGNNVGNRLLFTYSNIEDARSSDSSPFPHIDILKDNDAFMSAGYELFTWNNKVKNTIFNIQNNVTITFGNHKLIAGASFEHQKALNNYMRYGTGYYKYASFDDFKNGNAPIAFGLTYGYNGELEPAATVKFAQSSLYVQDEWNISNNFKLTYGIRADMMNFLNDLETNEAYRSLSWKDHFTAKNDPAYDTTYKYPRIDTGKWPSTSVLFSPRVGFNWDIMGDNSLVLRGGTGIFTGRIPLVFFTNMPTNSGMMQNTVSYTKADDLAKLTGKIPTTVDGMTQLLGLPNAPASNYEVNGPVKGATVVGVADDFKLPQVWKNTLAIDYRLPVSFPMTLSVEGMYNKDINAVAQENYNVTNIGNLTPFDGPDKRLNYKSAASVSVQSGVSSGAMVLTNTSKGYSGSINVMMTTEPVKNLNLMASYTHTIAKEISGLPGSQAYSSWQNLYNIDGPNAVGLHNSQYLTPNRIIASASYAIEYGKGKNFATTVGLFYAGYRGDFINYSYNNDMNGDGQSGYDLIYIPKSKDELLFATITDSKGNVVTGESQAETFWNFINQDDYLSSHKGEYAESYKSSLPWLHRFDLKIAQDFKLKVGKSMNTLQVSFDFLNIGNLINSSWGVTKTTSSSNYGKILNRANGTDGIQGNTPVYTLYNYDSTKKQYTSPVITDKSTTYVPYRDSSNCWQLQIGVRYIFN